MQRLFLGVCKQHAGRSLVRRSTAAALASPSLAARNIGAALDAATEQFPYKEALRCVQQDLKFSFEEFSQRTDDFASALISMQFKKGDTLALWLPNNAENLVAQYAAAKAGLTIAAIDPNIKSAEELAFVLSDSNARGLIYEPKMGGNDNTDVVQRVVPELAKIPSENGLLRSKQFKNLLHIITTGFYDNPGVLQFRHLFVNGLDPIVVERVRTSVTSDTPVVVPYQAASNGTLPQRGSSLTHGDLLKHAQTLSNKLKITPNDKMCYSSASPGLSPATLACLQENAQLILPSPEDSTDAIKHAMQLESCSIIGKGFDELSRRM